VLAAEMKGEYVAKMLTAQIELSRAPTSDEKNPTSGIREERERERERESERKERKQVKK